MDDKIATNAMASIITNFADGVKAPHTTNIIY